MIKEYTNYLTKWIKEQVVNADAKGVIVGISGGIDSAVVAALAKKAFPNNSLGVIMPIKSVESDKVDALKLIQQINIKHVQINLINSYQNLLEALPIKNQLSKANIKPRLRMLTLYALAQEHNYLVLGTDNAAEWYLGYFTKFGDGGVDLLPIVHLNKSMVKKMAKYFNVPTTIITKKPSAGLWEDQHDEDELGFRYQDIDAFLEGKTISKEIVTKINNWHQKSAHKRQGAPQPNLKPINFK